MSKEIEQRFYKGCGSVGRAVASDTRGPWFESSQLYVHCQLHWLDEIKEKEAGNGPFKNMFYNISHGNQNTLINFFFSLTHLLAHSLSFKSSCITFDWVCRTYQERLFLTSDMHDNERDGIDFIALWNTALPSR